MDRLAGKRVVATLALAASVAGVSAQGPLAVDQRRLIVAKREAVTAAARAKALEQAAMGERRAAERCARRRDGTGRAGRGVGG